MFGELLRVFGDSPLKPIQKHMDVIHQCVLHLEPFFEHVIDENWEQVKACHQKILTLEEQADKIKKDIRLHLPASLFMPVSRIDLLSLLTMQDKMASKAKHIAGLVLCRRMSLPDLFKADYLSLVQRCLCASAQAHHAIQELDDLIDTGFHASEIERIAGMIVTLDDIERETDEKQLELRMALFDIEKKLDPVEVIFLYKIIDWIGELADRAQQVGHRLENLLAQ